MKIYNKITELIGSTPLLRINNVEKEYGLDCEIDAKLEYFNPLGSVKDRVGFHLIDDAMKKGLIDKDTVIIEPTSGNTGVGLAFSAATLGMKCILTMPESMSIERRKLLAALGAQIVLTPAKEGMSGSVNKANELHEQIKNSYIPGQFDNDENANTHRLTTAIEILNDTDGKIDYFVACIGTGGTITGIGETLKDKIPSIKVIGVEPFDSPLLTQGKAGPHKIQGIGANFVPKVLHVNVCDKIYTVTTEEAYTMAREMGKKEGVLVGISSGAALSVAVKIAKENKGKRIVVLCPDSGERYLSTDLYAEN